MIYGLGHCHSGWRLVPTIHALHPSKCLFQDARYQHDHHRNQRSLILQRHTPLFLQGQLNRPKTVYCHIFS